MVRKVPSVHRKNRVGAGIGTRLVFCAGVLRHTQCNRVRLRWDYGHSLNFQWTTVSVSNALEPQP